MKNIILILFVFFCSGILFAQKENVKIELNTGNPKSFNIEDIEKLHLIKSPVGYNMKIYQLGSATPTIIQTLSIDSLKFESINNIIRNLLVYQGASKQVYLLFDIDSIVFSVPAQPTPVIDEIDPTSAIIGDNITIIGSNFGDTRGTSSVTFTGAVATNYIEWHDG